MNKEERREVRKKGRLFQRLHELFALGGYGRIVRFPKGELEEKVEETVLVEDNHVMACRLPPGAMGDALVKLMSDSECGKEFKYPVLDKLEKLKPGTYPMYYVLEALNTLAISDENVSLKCMEDYPVEIGGKESGIKFVIAPRIESE